MLYYKFLKAAFDRDNVCTYLPTMDIDRAQCDQIGRFSIIWLQILFQK